jgi:uncharacterized membrane protein YphA (DoxX/SURF4 family)
MIFDFKNESIGRDVLLLSCRFLAGGAFLIAAFGKIIEPKNLMLSMKSFELVPEFIIPFTAFTLPWMELVVGLLLFYGLLTRGAAIWATILYSIFTIAIISVIVRGMPVDCGCFGAMLGGGNVGWHSVGRNAVFLVSSGLIVWLGGGRTALDYLIRSKRQPSSASSGSTASEVNSPAKTESTAH